MRSAQNVLLEFDLWSNLRRKAGGAVPFIVCGSIAGASGLVMQMAGHEPNVDVRSVVATMPLNPSATLSTIASPASPAVSAPDNQQVSASPFNSPQPAPVNTIATAVTASTREATTATAGTASTREATTELPQQPEAASKKSQKAVRSPNQRNPGWNDASGWGRYGHERPSSSW
jgi:hypothetical protein